MRSYAGYLIILVAGLLCFVSGIGNAHLFDWDEINFAECAREMIVSGNYSRMQIGFQPFWEKPPLFIWLQALSMHVFGISAFAARLPNALIGTMALLVLYAYGRKNYDERMARLWVLMYAGSYLSCFFF
jgi:4-amino-4-deoxy-L-arabinose transferase-like glycosyltransferase